MSHVKSGNIRVHASDNDKGQRPKTISTLPVDYTDVPPVAFPNNTPIPRKPKGPSIRSVSSKIQDEEREWLSCVQSLHEKNSLESEENISWSAYMANKQVEVPRPPAITGLLPLFRESAHTLAMVKHGMNMIK